MRIAQPWLPLASLCSLTIGCAAPATSTRFVVGLRATGGTCITAFEGRDLTDAELLEIARVRVRKTHEAQVAMTEADVPWRCVAGLIYRLQMEGFDKINFAALRSRRR